jgi:integrase
MPVIRINHKNVKSIVTPEKNTFYFDDKLVGFGLKITPTGARSWFVEYRPGAGGRSVTKKRMRIGGMELSPDQARAAADKLLSAVSLGSDPAADRAGERGALSVAEIAERFMNEHVRKKRKDNSIDNYEDVFEVHVKPAIGKKSADLITRSDLTKLHNQVGEKKADGTGGPYIANKMLAVLSKMYNWAGDLELVKQGYNPTQKIERFGEEPRERFLTGEELERLGAALNEAETGGIPYNVSGDNEKSRHRKGEHTRHIVYGAHVTGAIRLLLLTGCRLREILHLRWSEVDFDRGLLFLPDSKTGRKTVVLSDAAIEVLKSIPRIGIYVVASESAGMKDEKPRHDIKKPWATISERADLKGVRLHDLRHTYASVGAGGGLGLPVIGKLLGHSQASTTQRYAHLDVDPVRRAANIIAGNISGKLGGK